MTERCNDFVTRFVLKWECSWPQDKTGQLTNDKNDPGGITRWGIDKRAHPNVDVANLTFEGALAIYAAEWDAEGCESMPPKVGEAFFDAAVNCGMRRARQFMEKSPDAEGMVDKREAFYHRLVVANIKLRRYLSGWLNRTRDLKEFLKLA